MTGAFRQLARLTSTPGCTQITGASAKGEVAGIVVNKTLADQVGGLLMFGFDGTTSSDLPRDLLAQAGGVILFRRNIREAQQVRELTDAIRSIAHDEEGPPLIALDQEGGTVSRLAQIGTTTPSAMALGAVRDPTATESMYRIIGEELGALGFNLDFAPVADVNNNPDNPVIGLRSFGDDPHAVGLNVRAAVRGLHGASVASTAKHYPGHGDTSIDSHFGLPSIPHDLSRVRAVELVPFLAAIAEGVDAIMTAHALFPAIEEQSKPATLSHRILTELLRDELRFEGVVITDCLEMEAIDAHYTPEQAAVEALAAGADLLLFSHTPDKVRRAHQALHDAVLDGRLSAERVQQSLERVAKLRLRLAGNISQVRLDTVGSEGHKQAALAVARRAITLVRDPKSVLPLRLSKGDRLLVIEFGDEQPSGVEDVDRHRRTVIGPALGASEARLHEQVRSLDPSGHEYKQMLMASGSANAVVAVTTRAKQHPLQARALADLAMLGKRVIAVTGREPYDAEVLPAGLTVIASFGEDAGAMQAAADVILGQVSPTGKMPVSLRAPVEAAP